jgi:hypothetical protein
MDVLVKNRVKIRIRSGASMEGAGLDNRSL